MGKGAVKLSFDKGDRSWIEVVNNADEQKQQRGTIYTVMKSLQKLTCNVNASQKL